MKQWGIFAIALVVSASPAWAARDMCKILKDKGVLNDVEYNECKAAQEKDQAESESKTKEVLGLRLPKWVDAVTPFGDLRNRWEGFYEDGLAARNRYRIRGRFGLNVAANDELSGTFRLATGNPDDPISRNQTLDRTFSQKPFSLDQAYITLKPGKTFHIAPGWITILAGKTPVAAYKLSELVWDDDLTPDGATEIFGLYDRKEGFLRNLRINAFEWVVDEIAANQDPWMGGAQLVADTALGSTANWSLGLADYHWENMNSVAQKYLSSLSAGASSGAAFVTNSNRNGQLANSNSLTFATDPTDATKKRITGFRERFNIINANSELNFANPVGLGIPGGLFVDYAYNTQADTKNQGLNLGVGLGKAGKGWYSNSLKNAGDWGTSYTFAWVEKDAVPSAFSYSDIDYVQTAQTQKGSTNVVAHIIRFDYAVFANFQLTAKLHFINALDRKSATTVSGGGLGNTGNPTLLRSQLDAVFKF